MDCRPLARKNAANPMSLQNRVTPFGDIVAIDQRGLFTGNRGILHDPATRELLGRRWTNKAWITCVLEFRGVRRVVMGRRSWTELFFFDEAVALAAGHRPCFCCRRPAATAFAAAWARARRTARASAGQIDAILHEERLRDGEKKIHPLPQPPASLPDGATVTLSGDAYVMARGRAFRWTAQGYEGPRLLETADGVLTPPSTLAALRAGYHCVLHPTLLTRLAGDDRHGAPRPVRRPRSATRK